MKTRIISGVVMAVIVAVVVVIGHFVPVVLTVFAAVLCDGALYELTRTATGIQDMKSVFAAAGYGALMVFLWDDPFGWGKTGSLLLWVSVVYFLIAVGLTLWNHADFSLASIAVLTAMPLPVAFAFSCLSRVINHTDGLYYLLLMLNFASVCDMGAYFVGSAVGKHKLCPAISPKKTVEGAVGGILSSMVVSVILCLCFGFSAKLFYTVLLTVPFCVIGMGGDLFASAIKRSVGIKDYGRLIPGHGGVLDRLDSILLIAPVLWLCIETGWV
ncbi:MAG: phosphatidate cytidylyltransferase [Clostridia bacterium]|nr:phosphatidate cytidylyltransferase [Clostridia bacterium]